MRKIRLTKGKYALVDDEDFDFLNQWNWTFDKYAYRQDWKSKITKVYMHRVLMQPSQGLMVDHINRNKLDNRRKNLRIVTASQNGMNRGLSPKNKSGYSGISWSSHFKKWQIQIQDKTLGYSRDLKEAIKIRKNAERYYDWSVG